MMQCFEWYTYSDGGFYRWLKEQLDHLYEIGINALWLPPACKATGVDDVGYGIYDLYDLGEFNQKGAIRTKYGTKEELLDLIKTAQEKGFCVYADVVLNHKAGADYAETFSVVEVDEKNRWKVISEPYDIDGWTGFRFPGRDGKYSEFVWNHTHFTGVDFDGKTGKTSIFKILGEGKNWAQGVSMEYGNYDYLMFADIDHRHPEVVEELFAWSDWFYNETKVNGYRLDALKHINDFFMRDFARHSRKGKEDFYIFGEYWAADGDMVRNYAKQTEYEIDLLDVALHFNFYHASQQNEHYDLRRLFDNSLVQRRPTMAVTFVDNHDSQPDQALSSWVDDWFKPLAYGAILLRKDGYPCIFFGDYYGIGGDYPLEDKKEIIEKLLLCRKRFAYGEQHDYFVKANCIGWVRLGDEEHPYPSATLMSNHKKGRIRMFVGTRFAGSVFADYLGNRTEKVVIDSDGYGEFVVAGRSISCWVQEDVVPKETEEQKLYDT
ncbi:MAG: alpha-amylase [Eubacteriaceae bacterium]|jgi:alpha-amylase|nr:alpha-amylase [Eubacteriaceae bacterium]